MSLWTSSAELRPFRLFFAVPLAVVAGGAAVALRADAGAVSPEIAFAHAAALNAPTLLFWALTLAVAMKRLRLTGWGGAALAGFGIGLGWSLLRLALAPGDAIAAESGLAILRDGLSVARQAPLAAMLVALVIRATAFVAPGTDRPYACPNACAAASGRAEG